MTRGRQASWDAVVVGGGHNGLVCAAYLARAGLRTLVLERRAEPGGAAATRQIAPGARVPAYAHTVGRLAPAVARDLALAGHGLRLVQPAARVTSLRPDGPPLTLWSAPERTAAGLETHSTRDAAAWAAFDGEVRALASVVWRLMLSEPPDPAEPTPGLLPDALRLAWRYARLGEAHARDLTRVVARPVADWLEDRFEHEALLALVATRGLRLSSLGPHDAGSTLQLLTDAAGNGGGAAGETVYARGGPGALAAALSSAARARGATLRTSASVARVLEREGRVAGAVLADGEEVAAPIVVSGLDPKTTLLELVDPESLGPELGWEVASLRARGVVGKVNLALSALPTFSGLDGPGSGALLRGRLVVAPSVAALERTAADARSGRASEEPWLEATIPSLVDPLLVDGGAGEARHVMSVIAQASSAGSDRDALHGRVMARLEAVAPGIAGLVVGREVLTPDDLQAELGLSGGHPLHLEPGLDQWFAWRPLLGLARYRMPLEGLYLCGAGAHPGGGLTGLPGRNAARRVLADLNRPRWRRALAGSRPLARPAR